MTPEEFLSKRRVEIDKHRNHPLFLYLSELKSLHRKAFSHIMFFLGEMMEEWELTECSTVWWIYDCSDDFDYIYKAFQLVCPTCTVEKKIHEDTVSFRIQWASPDDMDSIVYNKWIFPDFAPIDKDTLDFI